MKDGKRIVKPTEDLEIMVLAQNEAFRLGETAQILEML